MIAGVATVTIVVSTMIMKNPSTKAQSAGHGSFSVTEDASRSVVVTTRVNHSAGTVIPVPHALWVSDRVEP